MVTTTMPRGPYVRPASGRISGGLRGRALIGLLLSPAAAQAVPALPIANVAPPLGVDMPATGQGATPDLLLALAVLGLVALITGGWLAHPHPRS